MASSRAHAPAPSDHESSPSSTPSLAPQASTTNLRGEHALLAAYETRPTRPKRSSSERSKEFRAKRKQYEHELQSEVDALRRQVAELNMRRNIWQEKIVHVRNNLSGSLIKLVREYYLVFQHGLAAVGPEADENPKAKYQLDFLQQAMHPNVQVGELRGIAVVVEQWRRYTVAHSSFFIEVGAVEMFGPDDDPVVKLRTKLHVRISLDTFALLFPRAQRDPHLVDKFLNRQVTYECISYFRFTGDGRICRYDGEVAFVEGLLRVTGRVDDVEALMRDSAVLHGFIIDDVDADVTKPDPRARAVECKLEGGELEAGEVQFKVECIEEVHRDRESKFGVGVDADDDADDDVEREEKRKLSMNFLLS